MQRLRWLVSAAALPLSFAGAQSAQAAFTLPAAQIVGASEAFGQLISGSVGPDGSLFVADYLNHAVFRYSPSGALVWRAGRKGKGPGEFQLISRLTATPDGGVAVYDQALRSVSRFGPDGAFIDTKRFDRQFRHVVAIVALSDGGFAVAGVISDDVAIRDNAVHFFNVNLRHVRSVAPLPPVTNPAIRGYWGAGALTATATGDLLFARRHPYEVYRLSPDGIVRGVVRIGLPLTGTPDDAFVTSESDGVMRTRARTGVTRILPAFALADGRILVGRADETSRAFDLVSSTGTPLASRIPMPAGWDGIIAYDAVRNVAWGFGTSDDAPVVLRIPLAGLR